MSPERELLRNLKNHPLKVRLKDRIARYLLAFFLTGPVKL
jgi:hypothetical protein